VNSSNRDVPIKLSTESSDVFLCVAITESAINFNDMLDSISEDFPSRVYKALQHEKIVKDIGQFAMTTQTLKELESRMKVKTEANNENAMSTSDNQLASFHMPDSPLWKDSATKQAGNHSPHLNQKPKAKLSKVSSRSSNLLDNAVVSSTLFAENFSMSEALIDYENYLDRSSAEALYIDCWCRKAMRPNNRRRFAGAKSQNHLNISPRILAFDPDDHQVSPLIPSHKRLSSMYDFHIPSQHIVYDTFIDTTIPAKSSLDLFIFYRPAAKNDGASVDLRSHALTPLTALTQRNFKLSLSWLEVRELSTTTSHTKQYLYENRSWKHRTYSCKSMCCLSYITVSPQLRDLKDCNVGDFYVSTFLVTNHSDLETRIKPYVESETLSIPMDQNFVIPPKESISVRFDYVAQLENTDYHRRIIFLNENNAVNHQMLEVRARNIDTQQVLQHSLFYKIFTGNKKQQLQIYYDVCLLNMPNVRTFRIRNTTSQPIHMQIIPCDERYDGEIVILALKNDIPSKLSAVDDTSRLNSSTSLEDLKWSGLLKSRGSTKSLNALASQQQVSNTTDNLVMRSSKLSSVGSAVTDGGLYSLSRSLSNTPNTDSIKHSKSFSGRRSMENEQSLSVGNTKLSKVRSSDTLNLVETSSVKRSSDSLNNIGTKDVVTNGVVSSIEFMRVDGYPFSYINRQLLSFPDISVSNSNDNNSALQTTLDSSIRAVQKATQDLNKAISFQPLHDTSNMTTKISSKDVFTISATSYQAFSVIFFPKSDSKDESELNISTLNRLLQIKLLSKPASEDSQMHDDVFSDLSAYSVPELKPRSLVIRAKACRSEMSIVQRNINYGKIYIGETSVKSVTITNRSAVPLLYGILKSGSISSGFLQIPSGRRGQVAAKSSVTISFVLKPSLAGSFEEVITIYNVLNPEDVKSLTVKAKVMKPEVFQVMSSIPVDKTGDTSTLFREDSSGKTSIPNLAAVDIGSGAVGQPFQRELSFDIKNVSNRKRQLIVDANHIDAVVLSMARMQDDSECMSRASIFDADTGTLESIVYVRCKFDVIENESPRQVKLSEEERQVLSDKLEKFSQKLKIAHRKNKSEKIVKYEKKVSQIQDLLSGKSTSMLEDDDEDEADNMPIVSPERPSNVKVVANSDISLHFDLEADVQVTVRIQFTFIPGSSYRKWNEKLFFHGYLRVFEIRNEDNVKLVPFSCALYSSLKSFTSSYQADNQDVYRPSIDELNESNTPLNSLVFPAMKLISENVTRFRVSSEVMLTTVSQWSSYPTKLIFQDYRYRKQNILGMSVKLVQMSKDGIMQGFFSVDSLTSRDVTISFHLMDKWSYESTNPSDVCYYDSSQHGKMAFTIESSSESEIVQYGNEIQSMTIPSGGRLDCLLQYQPDKYLYKTFKQIIGCICIQVLVREDTVSVQYVPLICFLERKSSFYIQDKYVNFGEVHAFSSKLSTVTIVNSSDEDLHYFTSLMYASSQNASIMPSIGRAVLKNGHTGVIPAQGKKEVTLKLLTNSKSGRFEQDLWILNLTDRSDQKKVSLLANVVINPANYILFPDITYKDVASAQCERLDFGYIQLPKDASYSPPVKYHYELCIQNISAVNLFITATSNLKNQCFIYADAICTQPLTLYSFEAAATISVYIVIRPSISSRNNLTGTSLSDISKSLPSNPNLTQQATKANPSQARELIGGIRFEYFLDMVQNQGSYSSSPEAFFEVTMDFHAIVGQSQLSIKPCFVPNQIYPVASGSTALKVDTSEPKQAKKVRFQSSSPGVESSKYQVSSSSFFIENKSPTFQLLYNFLDSCHVIFTSTPLHSLSDEIKVSLILEDLAKTSSQQKSFPSNPVIVIFVEDQSKMNFILTPNQEAKVEYSILYDATRTSGLVKFTIKLRNVYTGDIQIYQNSIFIDPGIVKCIFDEEFIEKYLSDITMLVRLNDSPSQTIDIIGSSRRELASWTVQNLSDSPITVTPVSNIPVLVTISDIFNSKVNIGMLQSELFQSVYRTVRREDPSHRSLLTLTSGHWKSGLSKCGDSVTIPANAQARLAVTAQHGGTLSGDYLAENTTIFKNLNSQYSHKGNCFVALVHSNQALHSFYQPSQPAAHKPPDLLSVFHQDVSSTRKPPVTNAPSSLEVIEVISVVTLAVKFVVPKVKAVEESVKIGSLRCGRSMEFSCEVQNLCEIPVPIVLEGLPSWIRLCTANNAQPIRMESIAIPQVSSVVEKVKATRPIVSSDSSKSPAKSVSRSKYIGAQKLQLWLENKSLVDQSASSNLSHADDNDSDLMSHELLTSSGGGSSVIDSDYDINYDCRTPLLNIPEPISTGEVINEDLEQLSMQVAHMSMAIESPMRNRREGGLRLSIEDIYEYNQPARSILAKNETETTPSTALRQYANLSSSLLFIPALSKYSVKLIATAPRIESQTLEHKIHVKNVASLISSSDGFDIVMLLEVDSSKLFQLYSSLSGQKLNVSGPRSTPYLHISKPIEVPNPNENSSSFGTNLDMFSMASVVVKNLGNSPLRLQCLCQVSNRLVNHIELFISLPIIRLPSYDSTLSAKSEPPKNGSHCEFDLMPSDEMEVRVCYRSITGARISSLDREIIPLLFDASHGRVVDVDADDLYSSLSDTDDRLSLKLSYDEFSDNASAEETISQLDVDLQAVIPSQNEGKDSRSQRQSTKSPAITSEVNSSTADAIKRSSYIHSDGLGPILISRLLFKCEELIDNQPRVSSIDPLKLWSLEPSSDTVIADVVGLIKPRPIFQVEKSTETSTLDIEFACVDDSNASVPILEPPDTYTFLLKNLTSMPCMFVINATASFRHPNLRMKLFDRSSSGNLAACETYDSFKLVMNPSSSTIPPQSSIEIAISVLPCPPAEANLLSATLPTMNPPSGLFGRVSFEVMEESQSTSSHPPLIVQANLFAKVEIPIISSAPVSIINRSKQHLGDNIFSPTERSNTSEPFSSSASASARPPIGRPSATEKIQGSVETYARQSPIIRVRGATPSLAQYKRIYEINLGQQTQKHQYVEWLTTIENRSSTTALEFQIYFTKQSAGAANNQSGISFLSLGQHRGYVNPNDSTAVMMYCYRSILGQHSEYGVIRNLSYPGDIHLLHLTMDVVLPGSQSATNQSIALPSIIQSLPIIEERSMLRLSLPATSSFTLHYDADAVVPYSLSIPASEEHIELCLTLPQHAAADVDEQVQIISYGFHTSSNALSTVQVLSGGNSCVNSYPLSNIIQDLASCRNFDLPIAAANQSSHVILHQLTPSNRECMSLKLSLAQPQEQSSASASAEVSFPPSEVICFYQLSTDPSSTSRILSRTYLRIDYTSSDPSVASSSSAAMTPMPAATSDDLHAAVQTWLSRLDIVMSSISPAELDPVHVIDMLAHLVGLTDCLRMQRNHRSQQLLKLILLMIEQYQTQSQTYMHDQQREQFLSVCHAVIKSWDSS
jgi:hypothetical protein